ncbi:hypothetical protein RMSM_01683 [Rhodopirellula maiorica SM1]|uniref:Uncharacterized protein n=1 Tax=Rhodopirellula maiorica SM1 TaxID=1265738 RepID=M5S5C6_9BACT|nr:hypothetical protein RMSM_01683 [Rhodopirellula maiorica SM1]
MNADLIAAGLSPFKPESPLVAAERFLVGQPALKADRLESISKPHFRENWRKFSNKPNGVASFLLRR